VGCGSGIEAGLLAKYFDAETIGIDIGPEDQFDFTGSYPAKLLIMDAQKLQFPDEFFDFVFSFHALEHIADPRLALKEMNRVLKHQGVWVIGTPNKSRLLGYIGSATSFPIKVKWNYNDWMSRIKRQWSNEDGAHAGFTEIELADMCRSAFNSVPLSISAEYYQGLYGRLGDIPRRLKMDSFINPCVYVMGIKDR